MREAAREYRVIVDACEAPSHDIAGGLASLPDESVDAVITDPPYAENVHDNVMSNRGGAAGAVDLGFAALQPGLRRFCAQQFARVVKRWVVIFSDHEGSVLWRRDLALAGLEHVRYGIWRRVSPMPQVSGDRPAQGHEVIVIAHRRGVPGGMRWNGGGRAAVWDFASVRGDQRLHETEKPLPLMVELVKLFSDDGEIIIDPFAGSGSTLVAAAATGRHAIGWEMDRKHAVCATERLAAMKRGARG